jgi:two-component system, OmpR family, sensor kinase
LITLFFVLIFLLINGLFWIAMEHFAREHEAQKHRHFHFESHGKILFDHRVFTPPPPPPPPSVNLTSSALIPIWIVFITIDLLILAFFAFLLKKLTPLHRLKESIAQYKDGDQSLDIVITGRDEIFQIAEEFNTVLQKIASMREARALFLRNILHELKTPIMKGSLTADCLSPSVEQERLIRIFNRMNYLLDEFSKMERFSSGEWDFNTQKYRFVDILDHACDILLCNKQSLTIKGENSDLIINADFELFAIALKNLLDNAFKYSDSKPTLVILSHTIEVCSIGEAIPDENQIFDKPFNRTYESSMTGLGLGLYITDSILKKHGYTLEYRYKSGMNCFRIVLA